MRSYRHLLKFQQGLIFLCLTVSAFADPDSGKEFISAYVDNQEGLTLEHLVAAAFSGNPKLTSGKYRIEESEALRRQAAARPNPQMEFAAASSAIAGEPGDSEWSAGYHHTIELGSKRARRISVADLSVVIAQTELAEVRRQVLFDVRKSFAEVVAGADTLAAVEKATSVSKQIHEITVARVAEGEAAAVERGLTEVELSRFRAEAILLATEIDRAVAELKRLTGIDREDFRIRGDLNPPFETGPPDLPALADYAKNHRPDFALAKLQVQQVEAEIELARAEGVSDLNAFLEYRREKARFDQLGFDSAGNLVPIQESNRIVSAGLSLNLPLFDRNQGNIAAAIARSESARIRKEAMEKNIEMEVRVAVQRLDAARKNHEIYKDSILRQSEEQLQIIRTAYIAGELKLLDLMIQQQRTFEIQRAYISSAKGYFLASVELQYVLGTGITTAEEP